MLPLFSATTRTAPLIDSASRTWDSRQAFISSGSGSQLAPEVITLAGMPSGLRTSLKSGAPASNATWNRSACQILFLRRRDGDVDHIDIAQLRERLVEIRFFPDDQELEFVRL